MKRFNDEVIRKMYLEYAIPADRLVSDPDRLVEFTGDYNSRAGDDKVPKLLAHRILNLRRRGEDKGGLRRLRRRYFGRNGSDN